MKILASLLRGLRSPLGALALALTVCALAPAMAIAQEEIVTEAIEAVEGGATELVETITPDPETADVEEVAADPIVEKGDVAWMMMATILVVAMILPGLALFYGGLVRAKNMLSVLMQVSTCAIIGMIVWALWGYSLSFGTGFEETPLAPFLGGLNQLFLSGVDSSSTAATFSDGIHIPEFLFIAFQMTFAAITAALVLGSLAERMKFVAVVIFSILWPILSYYPIAHMVWAGNGFLFSMDAIDFAGGTVVHINAGVAGLVGGILLGHRSGYKSEPWPPHSLTMTYIGAALLWVGWFGFNAGSNLEATSGAVLPVLNTLLATATAGFAWILVEWVTKGKPSMLGLASGIIAGLVAITPACGTIGPMGAIILGAIAAPIAVVFCSVIKSALNYDDSLDVFGIHGVCGIVGALATGILSDTSFGGVGVLKDTWQEQFVVQAIAVGVSFAWAAVAAFVVFIILKLLGMRASVEAEQEGLDITEHGERAYHS